MRFLFLLFYYESIRAQGLNQPKIQVDNGHLKFTGIFKKTYNFLGNSRILINFLKYPSSKWKRYTLCNDIRIKRLHQWRRFWWYFD